MQMQWPLVGRGTEVEVIRQLLAESRPGGLVLAGAPGVGRSRLLRVAVEEAVAAGYRTRTVVATRAGSSVPFGGVAHLLPPDHPTPDDTASTARTFHWI